jgi:hypothetical protein
MDVGEFIANYELGGGSSPPLGARSAGAPSSPVNRNLNIAGFQTPGNLDRSQVIPFTPANFNSPSLNLVGGYELTRAVRDEIRRQDTSRRVTDNTRMAEALMQQQRLNQEVEEERRVMRENLQQVSDILEPALGAGAAAVRAAAANAAGGNGRPSITVDLQGIEDDLNRQQQRVERAEEARRTGGASGRSSTMEETLVGSFLGIQKVLGMLNNPATRDNPEVQARNVVRLEKITTDSVERGLARSLQPFTIQQDLRTARMVGQVTGELEGKILEVIEKTIGARVRRIEDNEKLIARANTEKKDQLAVLLTYPPDPGASPEVYRKALAQSNNAIRVIEKTYTYATDPFNYVMMICRESNKLAADFYLSKNQQRNLILEHVPISAEYNYLKQAKSLEDLFLTVSTLSTQAVTRASLEKQINAWRLNNRDETVMYRSIVALMDLLDKSREDYEYRDAVPADLFRAAVAIIYRQDGIPRFIREKLEEARLRVRDSDGLGEMTQVLASACQRYVGVKPSKSQNKQITTFFTVPTDYVHEPYYPQVHALAMQQPMQQVQQHPQQQRPQQQQQGGQQKQKQQQQKKKTTQQNQPQPQQQNQPKQQFKKKGGKNRESKFVKPWPENTPYLSKNGNTLRKEFEEHFKGHCFRCGHVSHDATKCQIYPTNTTVLTLCTKCRQGLHDTCKSKRRDLVKGAKLEQEVERQVNMICSRFVQLPPVAPPNAMYGYPYGYAAQPMLQQSSAVVAATSDSDSD